MLVLRAMRADEYPDFLDYFIPDYAIEIAVNYNLEAAAAKNRAISEIEQDLPQGVNTVGHSLTCIIDFQIGVEHLLGYLWYRTNVEKSELFIYDFYVFPREQGKGYGKEAMRLLEEEAAKSGVQQIKLRVAANNPRAKKLYDNCGFHVTGINMSKHIGAGMETIDDRD
ncbi:GNAT family N-acetyltransferase [Phyllobacterium sp. SB3]|uniref:GNAT family N-acetyltransferase n=1 Tax=Phyllobacterium sp. SB3 TaxID=3156073 RepID=UPI0032AF9592